MNTIVQVYDEHQNEQAKNDGVETTWTVSSDAKWVTSDYAEFTLQTLKDVHKCKETHQMATLTISLSELKNSVDVVTKLLASVRIVLCIEINEEQARDIVEVLLKVRELVTPTDLVLAVPGATQLPPFHGINRPFSIMTFKAPPELIVARYLRERKTRISVLEATTGGLIAAALLSVPGASSFFISGATVYTGRGAKRILPPEVLQASALFNRENNYANRTNYIESKRKYCEVVSKAMRTAMKADFVIVESGTTGPDFYIQGVEAFTAVGVAGPKDFCVVEIFESPTRDRHQNMIEFRDFALRTLESSLTTYYENDASRL